MFKTLFVGTLLACTPGILEAQESPECSSIESSLARLVCFDRQAAADSHAKKGPPKWSITNETDAITDSTTTIISVNAIEPAACNRLKTIPKLSIICTDETWFVRLSETCTLPFREESQTLLTRIDQGAPFDEVFYTTTARDDLQLSVAAAANLIRRMMSASTYRMKIIPDNGYPANIEFPVDGLTPALQKSGATCAL